MGHPLARWMRGDRLPFVFCSGCTIGSTMGCLARALDTIGAQNHKVVIVSGIGCTGRASGYFDVGSFHTTHGRPIPFATGTKMAKPDLDVIVFSGDGDLIAIGGNHLIHAARRNIGITIVCVNNFIYGMTGGQMAPTTPTGQVQTQSTPYGNLERTFNLVDLAASAGASYVARWTALHQVRMEASMAKAYATEMAVVVASSAIQCMGSMGLTEEAKVERLFRDARMMTMPDGTTQIQKLKIGHELIGMGAMQ